MGSIQVLTPEIPLDQTFPFVNLEMAFYSRYPAPKYDWTKIVHVFDFYTWIFLLTTLLCFGTIFVVTYQHYYANLSLVHFIRRSHQGYADFYLRVLFGIAEPDVMNWFSNDFSTGKFLSGLWMMTCLFLPLCFSCNLRAHLSKPILEKPLNTEQDIFTRGQNVWVPFLIPDPEQPEFIHNFFLNHLGTKMQVAIIAEIL